MTQRPGAALLWILACASLVLLAYEAATLVGSVIRPLLANPQVLQTDFHYYYEAAQRFSGHRGPLYSMTDDVIAGFAYPPPAIVPFIWLSKWPLGTALLAFTITSYLVLLASLQQWIAHLQRTGMAVDRNSRIAIMLQCLFQDAVAIGAHERSSLIERSSPGFLRPPSPGLRRDTSPSHSFRSRLPASSAID